jgi:hypothetical protein
MTVVAAPLAAEGQRIQHHLGRVTVVLTVIRPGYAYRAAVHHGGTAGVLGAEIPELSQSWPTEALARQAARRITLAFADQPQDIPFTELVERALASVADQLDDAISKALGGGDGTGRHTIPLGRLTAAREALYTPAERIDRENLLERLRTDLAGYDVDARYRAACEQDLDDDGPHSDDWYAGYVRALRDHPNGLAESIRSAGVSAADLIDRIEAGPVPPGRPALRVIAGGAS